MSVDARRHQSRSNQLSRRPPCYVLLELSRRGLPLVRRQTRREDVGARAVYVIRYSDTATDVMLQLPPVATRDSGHKWVALPALAGRSAHAAVPERDLTCCRRSDHSTS